MSINKVTILFLAVLLQTASVIQAESKKLNVVLIMADDIGYECFSAYGSKEFSTPRLDSARGQGHTLRSLPLDSIVHPSRVNLMTGKSNVFNYVDFGVFPKGEPTFANHFKAQGYATAVAGKWQLLTTQNGISPAEAGFDRHCVWNIPGDGTQSLLNPP